MITMDEINNGCVAGILIYVSSDVYVFKEGEHAAKYYTVLLQRGDIGEDHIPDPDYDERVNVIECVEHEKQIYRHLGLHEGIVELIDTDPTEHVVRTLYAECGDLRNYLRENKIDHATQLSWCVSMARTLQHVHEKYVLIEDVRTPNFVVSADKKVKLIDFGVANIYPYGTDLTIPNDIGYSISTDLGEFGAVLYEVVTGVDADYHVWSPNDCDENGTPRTRLPGLERLPDLNGIFLGDIIKGCWTSRFKSAAEVLQALEQVQDAEAAT